MKNKYYSLLPVILKHPKLFLFFSLCSIISFFPPTAQPEEKTGACHCFRNRTYNPVEKSASDGYLLTTTFNSLLASEFDISKRQIIMMKMRKGIANNDLITALYISKKADVEVTELLQMKKKYSWRKIIDTLVPDSTHQVKRNVFEFVRTESSEQKIAEHIMQILIVNRYSPTQKSIQQLTDSNLHIREIILALTLSDRTGIPAMKIANQKLENNLSWSEIAYNFGMQPSDVGKFLENRKPEPSK